MLGPVVGMELLRAGRRGRAHVLVWLFAGWLVLQLLYLYGQYDKPDRRRATPSDTAAFARSFVDLVLAQQLFLVVLVTPAFAAGAITDEKTRGTLQNLLTADLTPAAIVLGKLGARATQVIVLGLTPLPLVALVGPYAGVTPEFLITWLAVTNLLIVGLSAVGILASVWTRQTRNAVIVTYLVLGGLWWLFAHGPVAIMQYVPPSWKEAFDPLRPLTPALDRTDPAEAFRRLGEFTVAWGGLAVGCAALAVWRLRPAYLRQLEARRRWLGLASWRPRPAPTGNVLAWKERYVGRRVPLWLGVPLAAAASAWATFETLGGTSAAFPRGAGGFALMQLGWWVVILLTLIVGVRASGTITSERERQTWDGLMTAPLTPGDIVHGKLRGILLSVRPYLLAILLAATVTAVSWSPWAGLQAAFVAALGLAVTWLSMYFIGAVGLYCSGACAPSSWRSLLTTIAFGYVGGFLLMCVGTPLACLTSLVLGLLANFVQEAFLRVQTPSRPPQFWPMWEVVWPLAWALGVTLVYWWAARSLLAATERYILLHDRVAGRMIDVPFVTRARRDRW